MRGFVLAAVLAVFALAGCFSLGGGLNGTGPVVDASPDAAPLPIDAPPPPPDAGPPPCDNILANVTETGHHNAGLACTESCHDGTIGPKWTLAGTVYTTHNSTIPVAGITIHAKDAMGRQITMVTAQNGNFWTGDDVTFPVKVYASGCPDQQPMVAGVSAASCNTSGCHDDNFRIHLP